MNRLAIEAQVLRELPPHGVVHAAAAAGFDMAGIWIDPAEWSPAQTVRVRRAFAETGIAPLDAEVIRITAGTLDQSHLRLIDIAGEIGVSQIIAVSLMPDRGATVGALAGLADHAANAGVGIVLEFAPFSAVASAGLALELVEAAGPSIGILPDPIHLIRSGGKPSDLAGLPPGRIPFAQICDAGEPPDPATPDALLQEARHHRYPLGEGLLPLAEYVAVLPAGTIFSDETRSLGIERLYPDPYQRARALAERLRRLMRRWTADREE